MDKQEDEDRRKFPRLMTESLVSIARVDASDTLAQALDVSIGGMCFQCVGLELELGELLRVQLTLGEKTVVVVGKLVRVTDLDGFTQEMGLSFVEVDAEAQELLLEHLPEAYEVEPADQ